MISKRTVLGLEVEEAGSGSHGCVKRLSSCSFFCYVVKLLSGTRCVGTCRNRVTDRCKSGGQASVL